ncbi:protein DGCR6L isoform X3 [Mirounga angustirostris]|uniref:protein DGCR6L isoform X3 n=1 Tax=Mirounga angustirostris TaxID=9716 RepID=UPI0023E37A94|nr:protein DGCR6L isoform X3 [Mirounga angustirostris]
MACSFQQRLSYTTLSDLALALLDGTVFEIVQGLLEIQHLTEKSLYNQRLRLQNEHRVLRQALRQKHQEAQQACRPHNLPVLQAAQQRELEGAEPLSRPHHAGSGAPDPGGAAGNGPEDCPGAGPEGSRPAEHPGEGWGCWLLCDHQPTGADAADEPVGAHQEAAAEGPPGGEDSVVTRWGLCQLPAARHG